MSVLDQLAERMGIEPEFKDATGKIRRTDPKVSRSLLNSMGLEVENARKAQSMLRELERAEAGCSLPPVMVVAESATRLAVPLTLPRGIEVVRWSVREEDGASREGEVSFSKLAPLRARKAGSAVECRSGLAMVQLDDLTDERDQVNLPGTTDQHPNWRRKQSLSLEELSTNPRVRALAHILNSDRPPLSSRKSPDVR